jgi:hypothetical protein
MKDETNVSLLGPLSFPNMPRAPFSSTVRAAPVAGGLPVGNLRDRLRIEGVFEQYGRKRMKRSRSSRQS